MEDFDEAQHKRDKMQDELEDMRQLLNQIRETPRADIGIESILATLETRDKVGSSE
jgi:hypothetical protein